MTTKMVRIDDRHASAQGAYENSSKARSRIREKDLVHINVDIDGVVGTTLAAVDKLNALAVGFKRELTVFHPFPGFELENLTLALFHAQRLYRDVQASRPKDPAPAERAIHARGVLYACAELLVTRGLLQEHELLVVQRTPGHAVLASELTYLTTLFLTRWTELGPVSGLQLDEVSAALDRLVDLTVWMDSRARHDSLVASAKLERQRAYTLFFRCYTETRAAVLYVRRNHHDADDVLPSLYAGRLAKRRRNAALDAELMKLVFSLPGE